MQTSLALVPAPATPHDSYRNLVTRLSRASVKKHFDAYADVAWDAPEFQIEPHDPGWALSDEDPIGATAWYAAQPERDRARIGLATTAFQMKMGIAFEGILQRGLLELASTLPNGSPEFRYAMHEVIEEGQHSLMFQEFVNRSGFDAPGMSPFMAWTARRVPGLGRRFPELFFLHVLAGETPIDNVQRRELCRGSSIHPLKRRIMQIHVTEEARHVCFAEKYLQNHVPELGRARLLQLRAITPFVLRETAALILRPPRRFFDVTGIPRKVAAEAYDGGAAYRALTLKGLEPIRDLCVKLGIVTPALVPLWRGLGVWPALRTEKALTC